MKRRISTWILFVCSTYLVFGQSPQEWIGFNQTYVKVKVAEDGWYRLGADELQQAGFPISTVSAAQLQLFRRGQEVAIQTVTADGSATLNYLEFWGEKNTGAFDLELYEGSIQPHPYYNLFTDTATYFLTWDNNSNHLRIPTNTQNDNSGLTPTTTHDETLSTLQVNEYATGRFFGGGGGDFQLSNYEGGEGWTGSRVQKGSSQDFDFVLSDLVVANDTPNVEIIAIGRNSLQHVVTVLAGPDASSLTSVGTFSFEGYTAYRHVQDISPALVGANGALVIRCTVTGVDGATDFVSFSSVRLTYPQALNLEVGVSKNLIFESSTESRRYLQISVPTPENFTYYDITDPYSVIRLPQNTFTGRSDVVLPNAQTTRKVAAITNFKTVPSLELYSFESVNLNNKDYMIITHPLLRNHEDGSDPVQEYTAYRASAQGGGFRVAVAEIGDVYDQFNYGDPSVLAIRRLFAVAYNAGVQQALILAKGRTINQNLFRKQYGAADTLATSEIFVPTYGIPGGDNMYSIGLDPQNQLIPAIATGRVSAWRPDQVKSYLEKVIRTESTPFDQLWRKNLIHLSGGTTINELSAFASFIEDFKEVAEGQYLGGRAQNQNKQTSAVSEEFNISTEVNQGVGFITLFGHSSNTVTDVEIGTPSNSAFGYNNEGKYPLIIVNGCKAGEIFGNTVSFGEDWITYPSAGAIGFIAHADQASSANLKRYTDRLYDIGFADSTFFGLSIGEVMQEASRQYYNTSGTSLSSQTQIQQTLFQGDPAMHYFGPSRPDFSLLTDRVSAESITGEQLLTQEDSFLLKVPVVNFGRTTEDTLVIQIDRTYPDGSLQVYSVTRPAVDYADTLEIYLSNDQRRLIEGQNQLEIILDPTQNIEELNELNNQVSFELFISSGSTQHLFPYDLAVYSNDTIELIWQSTDPYEALRGYQLEIDTSASFESPFLQNLTVSGEDVLRYQVVLSDLEDGTVLYWRTRFSEFLTASDSVYATSSFSYQPSATSGWGQYSFSQLAQSEFEGLSLDPSTLKFSYKTTEVPVQITTQGTEFFDYAALKVNVNQGNQLATNNTLDPFCRTNTFNALVFDKNTGQLKRPIPLSDLDIYEPIVCGKLPQMIYNLTSADITIARRLEELIQNMESGDQVVLFNIDSVAYSSFDANLQNSLASVGVEPTIWSTLVDGQPFVAFGEKGAAAGSATTVVSNGSGLQPKQQTITTASDVIASADEGRIISPVIGPATSWDIFNGEISLSENDEALFTLKGVSNDGEVVLISQENFENEIDLSDLDATLYPYLYFEVELLDPVNLTPASVNNFTLSFTGSPEGVLIPNQKVGQDVQEGQEVRASFDFVNIGTVGFIDSVKVDIRLTNVATEETEHTALTYPPLAVNDTIPIVFERTTVGITGQNNLSVEVNTDQTERVSSNNRLSISNFANIVPETINPLVDVTIDGRYIIDGEIVSSQPLIQVSLSDENPYLLKTDTTGIKLSIKSPSATEFERVAFSESAVVWSAATEDLPFEIDYQPSLIDDGIYTLSVEASDESGNSFAEGPYEISFEVVNRSSITHFYPYPNPFSTQCRFVFTLTGSTIPEEIMIQIMTISGRVVKTIDEQEIGPVHIGNNITEYAWDGRDEYGDQLANGVYLYRVVVQSDGDELELRNTSADLAFKNGIGKIYILR